MNVYEVIFKGKIPLTFVKAILIPKDEYKNPDVG